MSTLSFYVVVKKPNYTIAPNCRAVSQRNGKNLALDLARKSFNYSTKNTPVHGKDLHIKTLISKSETFVKNIRWRAFFYLNPDLRMDHKETYGFISTKLPPIIPELKEFENDLVDLIQNIKFRHAPNDFQNKLRKRYKFYQ